MSDRAAWKDGIIWMLNLAKLASTEGDRKTAESLLITATIATGEMDR